MVEVQKMVKIIQQSKYGIWREDKRNRGSPKPIWNDIATESLREKGQRMKRGGEVQYVY